MGDPPVFMRPSSMRAALIYLCLVTMSAALTKTIYVYSDSSCTVSTANVSVTYSGTTSPICYDETDLATSVTTFERATPSCVDSQVTSVATSGTATGCASTDAFTADGTATFTSTEYDKYLAADCYTYTWVNSTGSSFTMYSKATASTLPANPCSNNSANSARSSQAILTSLILVIGFGLLL